MAEADVQFHSVDMADSHVTVSPEPQKSNKVRRCFRAARTPLFILVSLALLGLTIEAYMNRPLYRPVPAVTTQTPKTTSGQDGPGLEPSCKPFAHLDQQESDQLLGWSDICGMEYKDGKLVVQKTGHYFVYSKVSFRGKGGFRHSVESYSPYYPNDVTLMGRIKYSNTTQEVDISNSYLGGVFRLYKDGYIFVKVNGIRNLQKYPYDNFFGAFMIQRD